MLQVDVCRWPFRDKSQRSCSLAAYCQRIPNVHVQNLDRHSAARVKKTGVVFKAVFRYVQEEISPKL